MTKKVKIKTPVHYDLSITHIKEEMIHCLNEYIDDDHFKDQEYIDANQAQQAISYFKKTIPNLKLADKSSDIVLKEIEDKIKSLCAKTNKVFKKEAERIAKEEEAARTNFSTEIENFFEKGKYKFIFHRDILRESNLVSLANCKKYDAAVAFIRSNAEGDDFYTFNGIKKPGANDMGGKIINSVYSTNHKIKSNDDAKYEIFASFADEDNYDYDSDDYYPIQLFDIFIGKRFDFKSDTVTKVNETLTNKKMFRYYDEDMTINTTFVSHAVPIMYNGEFVPIDTENLSEEELTIVNQALDLAYQMYSNLCTKAEKATDWEPPLPIEDFKGIAPEHGAFFDHSIIS